jgi:lipopolysaccharide transport system permease protein
MAVEAADNPAGTPPQALQSIHLHIEPPRGWLSLNLRDLWEYRELLYFLAWRDVKVRYKQMVLGAAWAILSIHRTYFLRPIMPGAAL